MTDTIDLGGGMKLVSLDVTKTLDASPNGGFEATLSTPEVDRDGEVIDPGAFDPLPKSIPIFYDHDWQAGALPIGRGVPRYDGKNLLLDVSYSGHERAQEIRGLVNEGVIDSMSVGYVNAVGKMVDKTPHITGADLFEGSVTSIPANVGAQILAASAKSGRRNSSTDGERLQQIHDLATANGAVCATKEAAPMADEAKTLTDWQAKSVAEGVKLSGTYTIDGDSITFGDPSPVEPPAETSPTPDPAAEAAEPEEPAAEAAVPEPEEDPAIAEQLARITQRASA